MWWLFCQVKIHTAVAGVWWSAWGPVVFGTCCLHPTAQLQWWHHPGNDAARSGNPTADEIRPPSKRTPVLSIVNHCTKHGSTYMIKKQVYKTNKTQFSKYKLFVKWLCICNAMGKKTTHALKRETGEVTLGLSAGGPLSRTEAACSGLKSRPKERGGWALCFGASLSKDHCDETERRKVWQIQWCKDCKCDFKSLFFNSLLLQPTFNLFWV